MKLFLAFFLCIFLNSASGQNTFLYTSEGEKILITDSEAFAFYKGTIDFRPYKGENKSVSLKDINIKKVDSITVEGKITYRPLMIDGTKQMYLYKTLVSSSDKKVLIAFMRWDYESRPVYFLVDKNLKLIEKGATNGLKTREIFFDSMKKNFPGCTDLLNSIKYYENLTSPEHYSEMVVSELGFPYQQKTFYCN